MTRRMVPRVMMGMGFVALPSLQKPCQDPWRRDKPRKHGFPETLPLETAESRCKLTGLTCDLHEP